MHEFLGSHTFTLSERLGESTMRSMLAPTLETIVPFMGQSAEAIEIIVIDGNNNVIIDTIVDYGLTID
jgi:hypothetical protein